MKRMLKLIEEDGDSFAKKAEMYYQKRPELISHVEEFYRMYRSLAERYDIVTGELRKNIPSDLQSQGSGISDVGSEPPSSLPSPDQRLDRRRSGPRAAGFDVFLGRGSSADLTNKEGDETSTLDSEAESDDSSINNYSAASGSSDDQGLHRKIVELEAELRSVKEKLRLQQEDNVNGSLWGTEYGSCECSHKIGEYKEELRAAKEKTQFSEEEIKKLRTELQKYESLEVANILAAVDVKSLGTQESIDGSEAEVCGFEHKIRVLREELKKTKERLLDSENEVKSLRNELESNGSSTRNLQDKLGSAQKDVSTWKAKVDKEKREVSKLQDRIMRYKANLADRDQEIRALRETLSNANKSLSEENSQLQAEITKLLKERAFLEDNLKEWDLRCQCFEEDLRRVKLGKAEVESLLGAEIERLKAAVAEKDECIKELHLTLHALELQRDELNAKVDVLRAEMGSKDDQINQMSKHLHQLHIEHMELISGIEKAHKMVEELRSKCKELEREVERQHEMIVEGAEEKREAIRQLCFSLEHYRNGYHMLRQAFVGHKRHPVMAA